MVFKADFVFQSKFFQGIHNLTALEAPHFGAHRGPQGLREQEATLQYPLCREHVSRFKAKTVGKLCGLYAFRMRHGHQPPKMSHWEVEDIARRP